MGFTFHNAEAMGDQIGKSCSFCGHEFGWHEWIFHSKDDHLFCSEQCADTEADIACAEQLENR